MMDVRNTKKQWGDAGRAAYPESGRQKHTACAGSECQLLQERPGDQIPKFNMPWHLGHIWDVPCANDELHESTTVDKGKHR